MMLSKNFSLYEMTKSSYALRNNINNKPSPTIINNLKLLCENVLQPVRDHFRKPVRVNSGYRCPKLNHAIGGSRSSQHKKGMAADIEIFGISNYFLALYIRDNLDFDQLILEYYTPGNKNSGWVHVSFNYNELRQQTLTKISGKKGYIDGININT